MSTDNKRDSKQIYLPGVQVRVNSKKNCPFPCPTIQLHCPPTCGARLDYSGAGLILILEH